MREALATVTVRGDAEHSCVHRARPAGPLRLLCPRRPGRAAWVVAGNLGGGLVDGDDLALEVIVERGATCVVTTQAATKVYRGQTRQRTTVRVAEAGAAIVAPDPVVPFRDARFAQTTTIELAAGASLVLVDTITAGRVAHGERWAAAEIDCALAIAVAGAPRLIDRIVLDAAAAERMRRFDALATCVLLGPRVAEAAARQLAALARPAPRASIVVAGSQLAWTERSRSIGLLPEAPKQRSEGRAEYDEPGGRMEYGLRADGAVVRIAGERVDLVTAAVRAVIGEACRALGAVPWQRRW